MLVNDDSIGGYMFFDFGVGYCFNKILFLQMLMICFQLFNLFDRKYLSMIGFSGLFFIINVNVIIGINGVVIVVVLVLLFYVGVLCIFQVLLSSDF